MVDGGSRTVTSADGTRIGLVSAGSGRPLLLVHGGMTSSARWQPLWPLLTGRFEVSAMDRRGRGRSGDHARYVLDREFQDVAAVAADLAGRHGGPVDVFGHSIGAVCALGAAAAGAPVRRIALYEPPGPETVPRDWVDRATAMVHAEEPGRAMVSFLTEVIGVPWETVVAMRDTPVAEASLDIVAATLVREAEALTTVDLDRLARQVAQPAMLLLGAASPEWAHAITRRLRRALPQTTLRVLDGLGHEGVDTNPERVTEELTAFFSR